MFLHESTPCQQNSLILLQLLHEGRVRLGDGPSFLHIVKGGVQVPAILLHSVGYHCGSRAAHAHLTVNQTLGTGFPKVGRERGRVEAHELVRKRSLNCVSVCLCVWAEAYLALVMNLYVSFQYSNRLVASSSYTLMLWYSNIPGKKLSISRVTFRM